IHDSFNHTQVSPRNSWLLGVDFWLFLTRRCLVAGRCLVLCSGRMALLLVVLLTSNDHLLFECRTQFTNNVSQQGNRGSLEFLLGLLALEVVQDAFVNNLR